MKQGRKKGKRLLSMLLCLAMIIGMMPGMGLTALATEPEIITVTWTNTDFTGQTHTKDGVTINSPGVVYNKGSEIEVGKYGRDWTFTTTLGSFTKIEVTGGWTNTFPGGKAGWSGKTWTGNSSSVSASGVVTDANGSQPWTITFTIKNVPVTGVTLNPSAAQSINVGGSVAFTATVAPDGATDKTVNWSTTGGVTLYSDENCTAGNEIGADATSTLTVYAKGTAVGSATVTATSNADSTKSASCNVSVGKADQTAPTGLTATKASSNSAADGKISGVTSAMEYQIDGASAWTAVGENKTEITDLAAGTYKVRYAETANENASPEATIQVGVKEDQTAPTELTATKASSSTAADGKISNVTDAMEYQKDGDTSWTAVGNGKTEIIGLTAGTYKVRYAGTADKNASPAATVEVGVKVAPTVTAPTAKTLTYNGQAQELVIAGSTEDGTLYYAVTTENTAPTDDSLYTTSIPAKTEAGTYYVWYKVKGDGSHNDTEPARFAVTIAVDKTELNAAIVKAEEFYASIKDEEAYKDIAAALKDAIDQAKTVAANTAATAEATASAKETVAAAKATAEKAAAALKPAADPKAQEAALQEAKKESEDAMNMQAKLTQKGKTVQIKWTATKAADGYDVYVQYRGKNKKYGKPAMTITDNSKTKVTITKIGGKKINFAKSIKVKVLPFKIVDGKKVVLAKNNKNYLYGNKNKKATNAKSLKLKKSKVTLKKGKTSKIKATIKLVDKKKKLRNTKASPKLRYTSSDTSVATVTKKGKIKAVGKGTCTIYVSTLNGITKKVAVTVK